MAAASVRTRARTAAWRTVHARAAEPLGGADRRPGPRGRSAADRRRPDAVPRHRQLAGPAGPGQHHAGHRRRRDSVTWRCRSSPRPRRRRSSSSTARPRRSRWPHASGRTTRSPPVTTPRPTVMDLTGGKGVDVTVDLVGADDTLALGRRRDPPAGPPHHRRHRRGHAAGRLLLDRLRGLGRHHLLGRRCPSSSRCWRSPSPGASRPTWCASTWSTPREAYRQLAAGELSGRAVIVPV